MNDNEFNTQFYKFDDFDGFDDEPTNTNTNLNNRSEINVNKSNSETEDDKEDGDLLARNDLLWSIEDDTLFHPVGLINHSTTVGRSVFVTWNENYLQNFIFKKSSKSKQVNMTKVRLTLPTNEEIKEILILEFNTLLLMQSGRVYYLSSIKSMHVISWLDGVRCIAMASDGFSVIRHLPDNTLSLEVYRDVMNIGNSSSNETQVCAYDITFDTINLFHCQWTDEDYTLVSLKVTKENLNFAYQLVHRSNELQEGQEVHIFTVSGNVFALIPEYSADNMANKIAKYQIELLNIYASPVSFIKINCNLQICLIFFDCGSIDIWYISSLLHTLTSVTHHTGCTFVHYAYNPFNSVFYFTDTEKVGQLQFKFDNNKDNYFVEENYKPVADILVCTWVTSIQQLICLSSNNIFYQLNFSTTTELPALEATPEFETFKDVFEVTTKIMCKLLNKAHAIAELRKVPAAVHKAIEKEYLKQQVLALAKKQSLYTKIVQASLEFHRSLPNLNDTETVMVYTQSNHQMHENKFFALMHVQLTRNDIFQASLWQLHIEYSHTSYIFYLPNELFFRRLCIVVPLVYNSVDLLPSFNLKLLTFVANNNNEYIVITLPAQIHMNTTSFVNMFSLCASKYSISMVNKINIANLIARFKQEITSSTQKLKLFYKLSLPRACSLKNIQNAFNQRKHITDEFNGITTYFLSSAVKLTHMESNNSLHLECYCPVALHYTILYLYYYIKEHWRNKHTNQDDPSNSKILKLSMQYQSDVEGFYCSFISLDNVGSTSHTLHLENLKSIHTKIRSLSVDFLC